MRSVAMFVRWCMVRAAAPIVFCTASSSLIVKSKVSCASYTLAMPRSNALGNRAIMRTICELRGIGECVLFTASHSRMMMVVHHGLIGKGLERPENRPRISLAHFVKVVERQARQRLCLAGDGPEYLHLLDGAGFAQADLLPQRIRPETAACADRPVDFARSASFQCRHLDPRADGRPVRLHAFQLERQPVVAEPRILVQHVIGRIPVVDAAHALEDVLSADVSQVAERNSMPLLEMPEAARCRHLLEAFPLRVAEHPVRRQEGQVARSRPHIEVEPG